MRKFELRMRFVYISIQDINLEKELVQTQNGENFNFPNQFNQIFENNHQKSKVTANKDWINFSK